MRKNEKKQLKETKKALPSLIEILAKTLREEIKPKKKEKNLRVKNQAHMSNTIEQIAQLLREKCKSATSHVQKKKSMRSVARRKTKKDLFKK